MAIAAPPPSYQIERPAPSDAMAQAARSVADSVRMVAERTREALTPKPSQIEATLPAIDASSRALTREDRLALAATISENDRGTLADRKSAPSSYVGDRIRLAVDLARMQDRGLANIPHAEAAAFRCRMTAVAMDARAGRYVQGGEAAASSARRQVPQHVLAACRTVVADRRMGVPSPIEARQPRAIDPSAGRPVHPTRMALTSTEQRPVRIDLPAPHRVRIDFKPQTRVHVDPVADQRRSAPGMATASIAAQRGQSGRES